MADEHVDPEAECPPTPFEDLTPREQVKALMLRREEMEEKLQHHINELLSTPAGLDQPLKDSEGFPRADCDLHVVTKHRGQVACLRNDLRAVMREIEEKICEVHAAVRDTADTATTTTTTDTTPSPSAVPAEDTAEKEEHTEAPKDTAEGSKAEEDAKAKDAALLLRYADYPAFLSVGQVLAASPADDAGLQEGDTVLSWNGVTYQHPDPITFISQITARYANKELKVVVKREADLLVLPLTPKKWSGRGMLGCLLNKIKKEDAQTS